MRIFLVGVLFLSSLLVKGQRDSSLAYYLDSIWNLVEHYQIPVYDTLLVPVNHGDLLRQITPKDTFYSGYWMPECFLNCVYVPHLWFHFAERSPMLVDTAPSNRDRNYLHILREVFDPNTGEYRGEQKAFSIERRASLINTDSIITVQRGMLSQHRSKVMEDLETDTGTCWKLQFIDLGRGDWMADTCLEKYYLKLNSNLSFEHGYGSQASCGQLFTMNDSTYSHLFWYWQPGRYHLSETEGIWYVKDDNLVLKSVYGRPIQTYNILSVTDSELMLDASGTFIALKKEDCND